MTELQIAELRKLLREAPKEVHSFREAGADVMLTWKARDVLPKLLDEREALLEALRAVEWGGDSFQGFASVCPDCVGRADQGHTPDCVLAAAIVKAES